MSVLIGTSGNDVLTGTEGDDEITGGPGDDIIDGRGGFDTVILSGLRTDYTMRWVGDAWRILDHRTLPSADRTDVVKNVEQLRFADGEVMRLVDGDPHAMASMTEVVARLERLPSFYSVGPELDHLVDAGYYTPAQALAKVIQDAASTTSVATLSYEFFTGKIPTSAGIDYLVGYTGGNPNGLASNYYLRFNLENRYINFAVNLGKIGEGKDAFAAKYGSLSLFDATREAYKTIFGGTPTDAKVHALIDTRTDYFVTYGGDGANGIGTKAAMVGWLLAEAVKADIGVMAKANDAWMTQLATFTGAPYAVDILDPAKGYYKTDFIYGGG